jgi:orotate phosphoribosyltransferase
MSVAELVPQRRGHFRMESGFHTDRWLDLELLYVHPERLDPLVTRLSAQVATHPFDIVCGPLVEGAFLAIDVARRLSLPFTYSERLERAAVEYRIPGALRDFVKGKRVAIVNDVISAGSAVGKTYDDLQTCGATPVAIAALLILGDWTKVFAADKKLALEALAFESFEKWKAEECPLCRAGVALTA